MVKKREAGAAARRRFSVEERAAAVAAVRARRDSVREVARDLGINDKTLNEWVVAARNFEIDPAGSMSESAKRRIRELVAENARLQREVDFQKKARAFISAGLPRTGGSR